MNIQVYNIFYTDDDEDDQDFFKIAVHAVSPTSKIVTLGDGDELMILLKNPPPVPHIIFLDLNMPGKNGYDVLKEIRLSESTKHFPVVVFSTSDDALSINATRQLGANMYITKPSSIGLLQTVIKHTLSINWETFDSGGENFVYRMN